MADGAQTPSDTYEPDLAGRPFTGPLSDPPAHALLLEFARDGVTLVRRFVSEVSKRAGARPRRLGRPGPGGDRAGDEQHPARRQHGGGRGVLHAWGDSQYVHCQIADKGSILDPLVGRIRPAPGQQGGRGLWLVNQLTDLVQIRAVPEGTIVRLSQGL